MPFYSKYSQLTSLDLLQPALKNENWIKCFNHFLKNLEQYLSYLTKPQTLYSPSPPFIPPSLSPPPPTLFFELLIFPYKHRYIYCNQQKERKRNKNFFSSNLLFSFHWYPIPFYKFFPHKPFPDLTHYKISFLKLQLICSWLLWINKN